jgi:hypothetical protein
MFSFMGRLRVIRLLSSPTPVSRGCPWGGGLANAAYGALAEIAAAIREAGTFDALAAHRSGVKTFKRFIGD